MRRAIGTLLPILVALSIIPAGIAGAGQAPAGKTYKFRFGTIQPADAPVGRGASKFAELVGIKTNGRVTVDVYPASQLGNEKDLMDAVEMGTLEFALGGVAEWAKRYKPIMIFEGPFVYRNREHLLKAYANPVGQEVVEDLAKKTGARSLALMYYGTRHVTTSKTAARTPKEMNGLKLRCPDQPLYVQVVRAMGAQPTPMAFSEVYLALQQGVVDGQENPAATIATMKFYEVQKYLIKTGHIISGVYIWTNDKFLAGLPADIQTAIKAAAKEAAEWANAGSFKLEDEFLQRLTEEYKMTPVEPDHQAFVEAAKPLLAEYETQWGKGLLEKVRAVK
jgi:tripartite ATP-independent transporter DctP family solute receptor